jgi:transcription antitermination protein NusB
MNNIPLVFWLIPIASVVALGMAWFFFRSMMKEDEGTDRMKEIAAHVRKGAMAYQHYIGDACRNWDFNRLAYMDVVVMQIAIAELMTFPGIPATVTINEYVDLAKLYSTPRSGGYVNGMLDTIARFLISRGLIQKELPERKGGHHGPHGPHGHKEG